MGFAVADKDSLITRAKFTRKEVDRLASMVIRHGGVDVGEEGEEMVCLHPRSMGLI